MKIVFFSEIMPSFRDYVRILILRGLLVMDCLFLFLFSFLNPQIPGGAKSFQPPSNIVPEFKVRDTKLIRFLKKKIMY